MSFHSLLVALPLAAVASERAFRDYITIDVHRRGVFAPAVSELPSEALHDLWTFINHQTQFDMDAIQFDALNQAFQRLHAPSSRPA